MKRDRVIPNREFSSPVFLKACELASVPPTKRQASKWRNGKGLARTFKNAALLKLGEEAHRGQA